MVNLGSLSVGLITGTDLLSAMAAVVRLILLWAGIMAFFYALYGGFMYLTAGGDAAKTTQGQKTITNAVIGMIIISLSYILVSYVTARTRSGFQDTGATSQPSTTSSTKASPSVKKTASPKPSAKATAKTTSSANVVPSSQTTDERGDVSGIVLVDGGQTATNGLAVTIQHSNDFLSTIGVDSSSGSFQFPIGIPAGTGYSLTVRSLDDSRPGVQCDPATADVYSGIETTVVISCISES